MAGINVRTCILIKGIKHDRMYLIVSIGKKVLEVNKPLAAF